MRIEEIDLLAVLFGEQWWGPEGVHPPALAVAPGVTGPRDNGLILVCDVPAVYRGSGLSACSVSVLVPDEPAGLDAVVYVNRSRPRWRVVLSSYLTVVGILDVMISKHRSGIEGVKVQDVVDEGPLDTYCLAAMMQRIADAGAVADERGTPPPVVVIQRVEPGCWLAAMNADAMGPFLGVGGRGSQIHRAKTRNCETAQFGKWVEFLPERLNR